MTLRTCIYWPIDPNAVKCTISVLVLNVAFFYSEMSQHCHCACLLPHYICVSCLIKNSNFVVTVYGSSLYIACGAGTRYEPLRTSMWEASDIYALIKFKFDRANCIRLNSESLYPAKCFSDFIDMYVILYFFLPSYPSRTKSSITSLKKRTQRTLIKCLAINCTV